jgi:hypothetical protein
MEFDLLKGTYRHYKGNLYEVIGVGRHSETMEPLVVYTAKYASATYAEGTLWIRPLSMFTEIVVVNDVEVPRFEYVGE